MSESLEPRIVTALRRADVKFGLDIVLCLRAYTPLEETLEGSVVVHPVRTLAELRADTTQQGEQVLRFHDPVREELHSWKRSGQNDYRKIMMRLEMLALNEEITNTNVIKRVRHGDGRGLFEIVGKGDHARVFAFYDPPSKRIIVGSGTYWKLGRTKEKERKQQDTAILQAAARRDQWVTAHPIPGLEDWRVLRAGKEPTRP